jgi:hypothetical protein
LCQNNNTSVSVIVNIRYKKYTTSYIRVFFLGIYYLFSGEEKIIDTNEISETVNRRPDDVMAKREGTKIYIDGQNTTQKTKDSVM